MEDGPFSNLGVLKYVIIIIIYPIIPLWMWLSFMPPILLPMKSIEYQKFRFPPSPEPGPTVSEIWSWSQIGPLGFTRPGWTNTEPTILSYFNYYACILYSIILTRLEYFSHFKRKFYYASKSDFCFF